jgi:hypothetical protein
MGFGDKFKDLAKQDQDAVAEHKDEITGAVERAGVMADARTKGKYTDKIAKVGQKTGEAVEKLAAGSDRGAGSEPPPPGPESTDHPGGGQ